jgi:isocitrate dehydrogenase
VPAIVAQKFLSFVRPPLKLITISNRGTQVWPTGSTYTDCINQYRVRVETSDAIPLTQRDILNFSQTVVEHFKICSLEMLMQFGEKKRYSLAQGQ